MTSLDAADDDPRNPRDADGQAGRGASGRWWTALLPKSRPQVALAVVVLMFLAGAAGHLIGTRSANARPSAGSVEVGFLYDMAAHHQQALVLAEIELVRGERRSIQAFAREILRSQAYEMGLMLMRLGMWGHDPDDRPATAMRWMGMASAVDAMPGMASADEIARFRRASGPEADELFVALMRDHHAGGVSMAEHAAKAAGDQWVRDTAAAMASIQRQEIVEMDRARAAAGLRADPPGFHADALDADGHTGHST